MSEGMTRSERKELADVVRRRAAVAKTAAKQRAAELEADFEKQLATEYDPQDAAWRDVYEAGKQAVEDLNARIADECERAGIPAGFAPSAHMSFFRRGENYSAERRAELRKVAKTRIVALEAAAKTEIERQSVELQTQLIAGGLDSADAKAFLESMPKAEALMPSLAVAELEAVTGR